MANALCNLCGQEANKPWRRYSPEGKITNGCVDECHTQSLEGMITESARWHFRSDAKEIRRRLRNLYQKPGIIEARTRTIKGF